MGQEVVCFIDKAEFGLKIFKQKPIEWPGKDWARDRGKYKSAQKPPKFPPTKSIESEK